jgi:hypothetical protein
MKNSRFLILAFGLLALAALPMVALALPDVAIPADFYDGAGRKAQVDALVVQGRVPTAAEVTQSVTLRGDLSIQVKDLEGVAVAAPTLVRVWYSTTAGGAPSATDNTVAVATGTIIQAVTANAHLLVLTDANGVAVLRVTLSGAADRYANVEIGGRIVSVLLEIAVIE